MTEIVLSRSWAVKGQIWTTGERPLGTLRRVLYTFYSHHVWAQPGGSMRDGDSIKACDELGLAMQLTGRRHFLH